MVPLGEPFRGSSGTLFFVGSMILGLNDDSEIKNEIFHCAVLSFFDVLRASEIIADASENKSIITNPS